MTIKVKLRGNKAIVRFNNPMDENYFVHVIRSARDDGQTHPKISFKGRDGKEIPPRKPAMSKKQLVKIEKKVGVVEDVKPLKIGPEEKR